ncbi:unnamed protein product [Prunus armeniaca]
MAIYASVDAKTRAQEWLTLQTRLVNFPEPIVLLGDFNDILQATEKQGGTPHSTSSMCNFRNFVVNCGLLDLEFVGYPFTWSNRRGGGRIQERLDRALASSSWVHRFGDAKVSHHLVSGSDHAAILLEAEAVQVRHQRRFIYDNKWGKEVGCRTAVQDSWRWNCRGSACYRLVEKLKAARGNMLQWRRGAKTNTQWRILELNKELQICYQASEFDWSKVCALERDLKVAIKEEEVYWKMKSRVQWLAEGDKNTKGLENELGEWHDDEKGIQGIAVRYFEQLFTSSAFLQFEEIINCVDHHVSEQHYFELTREVIAIEIKEALFQIPPTKAPGPDGLTGGKGSGPSIKASLQKTKIGEAVVKLRAPVWCRPKALRCLSQLRRVTFAEEVKVGGWCRFPMWDSVQVAAVVTCVMRIRREGVFALVLVVLRLDMLG